MYLCIRMLYLMNHSHLMIFLKIMFLSISKVITLLSVDLL